MIFITVTKKTHQQHQQQQKRSHEPPLATLHGSLGVPRPRFESHWLPILLLIINRNTRNSFKASFKTFVQRYELEAGLPQRQRPIETSLCCSVVPQDRIYGLMTSGSSLTSDSIINCRGIHLFRRDQMWSSVRPGTDRSQLSEQGRAVRCSVCMCSWNMEMSFGEDFITCQFVTLI